MTDTNDATKPETGVGVRRLREIQQDESRRACAFRAVSRPQFSSEQVCQLIETYDDLIRRTRETAQREADAAAQFYGRAIDQRSSLILSIDAQLDSQRSISQCLLTQARNTLDRVAQPIAELPDDYRDGRVVVLVGHATNDGGAPEPPARSRVFAQWSADKQGWAYEDGVLIAGWVPTHFLAIVAPPLQVRDVKEVADAAVR